MTAFDESFGIVVGIEGGYSDNPNDAGGPTNHGITERVARANGFTGNMRDLPLNEAKRIAKVQYWDLIRGDDIAGLSKAIAHELFDTAYNMAPAVAGKFLQRSLNVLNRSGRDYGDLLVDGIVGPVTVADLGAFLKIRHDGGEKVMLRALNSLQGNKYIEITEAQPKDEDFIYGWLANRVVI